MTETDEFKMRLASPEIRTRFVTGLFAIFVSMICGAPVAFASSGAIELNHACATATGCLSGDTLGYPIQITTSGSFVLTSDLVVPDENTTGIEIDSDEVTIDLRGFAIRGPGLPGTGHGIETVGGINDLVRIRGGSIIGVGGKGVKVNRQSTVTEMSIINPGAEGITTSNDGMVVRCRVEGAGGDGISVGGGSMVIESQSHSAAGRGIRTVGQSLVAGSTAFGATGIGVSGTGESGLADSFVAENFGGGFNQQVSGFWFDLGGSFCGLTTPTVCP